MAEIGYGLGRFGDRRLEKGGPFFMRRLWHGHARASAGWQEHEPGRFNSPASCATIL
jgi:hypothetical protein